MAGVGRRTLYRKSVTDEYLNSTPEPGENEEIALVQAPRGSNIIEIVLASGEQALAILPTRFRKLIWVKRGDYLITSTSAGDFETSAGEAGKVRHRVEHILNKDQIKHLKKMDLWPEGPQNDFGIAGAAAAATLASGTTTVKDPRGNWGNAIPDGNSTVNSDESMPGIDELKNVGNSASRSASTGVAKGREAEHGCKESDTRLEGTGGSCREAAGKAGGVGEWDEEGEYYDDEEEDMSDLFVNNNRAAMMQLRTDHDDDDEEDSDSEDDESDC